MKTGFLITTALVALGAATTIQAQQFERGVAVVSEDAANQIPVFSYRVGPESDLILRSTTLASAATGKVEVEFQDGRARVEARIEKLPEPAKLGPYTLYVLWALTVEGGATNLGFFDLRSGHAELETTVPLAEFALVVTAEPHFAVTVPSKAVVLQNFAKDVKGRQETIGMLKERADYSTLPSQTLDRKKREPIELLQLRYAMAIANSVGAPQYAHEAYARADQFSGKAEAAQVSKKSAERRLVAQTAREGVQAAEVARQRALVARAEAEQQALEAQKTAQAEADAQRRAALVAEEARVREAETARNAAAAGAATATARARAELAARLNRILPTQESPRGLVAQIAGVQFATGKATLNTGAREALARFGGIVAAYPDIRFIVEGHTDSTGSDETNRTLSYARAITVRDFLIAQSVAASSIDVKGLGPSDPVADNATATGRAANRRVEIVMSGGPIGDAR
jgi:outer membrane protein OmpA-like peptidoglycan-associated protein